MFQLSSKPTFFFRVEVKRPNEATGRWETIEFQAEFKRRSQSWVEEFLQRKPAATDDDLLAVEFVGWRDVKQPDGSVLAPDAAERERMLASDAPLAEASAARTALLAEHFVKPAIARAWWEASIQGPAKN